MTLYKIVIIDICKISHLLISAEMKYLHHNGFNVLKVSNIVYNQSINYPYVKEPTIIIVHL